MDQNMDNERPRKVLNKKEFIVKVLQTVISGFIFVLCITAILGIIEDSNISPSVRLDRYGVLIVSTDKFPHASMDYSAVNRLTNKEVVKESNELCDILVEKFNEKEYNASYDITYHEDYKIYVVNVMMHCKGRNLRDDLPGMKWNFVIDTINTECKSWLELLHDGENEDESRVTVYFNLVDLDNQSAILFSSKNGSTSFDGLN